MTLFAHSGTAAIDLSKPEPSNKGQHLLVLSNAAGHTAVPNIGALDQTTKDWTVLNGIHRPPPPPIIFNNRVAAGPWQTASTVNIVANPAFSSAYATYGYPYQYSPPAPPPLLPTEKREMPVIGYRSWKFKPTYKLGFGHRGALLPLNEPYGAWKKGNNKASCKAGGSHRAGDQHCQCGFYVISDLDAAASWAGGMVDDIVVGAVMGWGQVVQHGKEGWRAEYAKIIALLDCKFSKKQDANTKAAADSYGLEIYSRNALEAYVKEWGDPLPEAAVTP
jgi:hypothetical protein